MNCALQKKVSQRIDLCETFEISELHGLKAYQHLWSLHEYQILAEAVRFELTEDSHPRQFSRLVHSTALPSFLD